MTTGKIIELHQKISHEGYLQDIDGLITKDYYLKSFIGHHPNAFAQLGGEFQKINQEIANDCFQIANDLVYDKAIEHLENSKLDKAVDLLKETSKNNHILSVHKLAELYASGKGVDRNDILAMKYCKQIVDSYPYAMHTMAMIHKGNNELDQAIKYLKSAVQKGIPDSMFELGSLYEEGEGVEKNSELALKYYTMAMDGGYLEAMNQVARMYKYGIGVEKDPVKAIKYYKMAIKKGYVLSMFNLGDMFQNGKGVKPNYQLAIKYYEMAAEKGDTDAMNNLGSMYKKGEGVEQDEEKAIMYYRMAIEKGNSYALNNLIQMCPGGLDSSDISDADSDDDETTGTESDDDSDE